MHIMTKNGWTYLDRFDVIPASDNHGRYAGKLPSADVCAAYNAIKEQLKYFDDGVRMVYGKPDKVVETDNMEPIHPIAYPPEGF